MRETPPKRRPLQLRRFGIEEFHEQMKREIPYVVLGRSALKAEMNDAGWPARTPDDDRADRKPRTNDPDPEMVSVIDYLDPTGDTAAGLLAMSDDDMAMQDHWQIIETSWRAIMLIARRHQPKDLTGEPCCWHCSERVESRRNKGGGESFVDMENIGGIWVAKAGKQPACRKHRARREREAA